MPPRDKKPFIHLCFSGSLTLLAILNMMYIVVHPSDPFTIFLVSDLIGSVPLFLYFLASLNATIILLTVTLLTLTSAIQADTEALIHQYLIYEQALEASPDALLETTPQLVTVPVPSTCSEEVAIHALNEQVQRLQTEVTQQHHDALIQELQDLTLAATARDAQSDTIPPRLVEDPPSPSQLMLHSTPSAIKGIGAKTETALQAIGVTTVCEFLMADPEWIAKHTPLTSKQARHFQEIAYATVSTEAQQSPNPSHITPSTT